MIIEMFQDMKYFSGILIVTFFAFSNSFYVLGQNTRPTDPEPEEGSALNTLSFVSIFMITYKTGLGDF